MSRVAPSFAGTWAELLELLRRHAPRTLAALRAPEGDLEQAQRRLGVRFTAELAEWFETVDAVSLGRQAELLPFSNVVGLERSVVLTEQTRSIWADAPPGDGGDLTRAGTWAGTCLAQYVYVGEDGSGGGLFVDLRDGPERGCVRVWDDVDADVGQEALAANLTELLDLVIDAVRSGGSVAGWVPVLEDGLLAWTFDDT